MTWLPTKAGASRLRGLVLLLGLTAFAMTGCIRYELAISINDDGSGVLGTIVAISDAFTQATGASTEELVPPDDLPPNVDVSEYRQGRLHRHRARDPLRRSGSTGPRHRWNERGRRHRWAR